MAIETSGASTKSTPGRTKERWSGPVLPCTVSAQNGCIPAANFAFRANFQGHKVKRFPCYSRRLALLAAAGEGNRAVIVSADVTATARASACDRPSRLDARTPPMTQVFQNDKYVGDVRAVDGEIATLVERRMAQPRWRHMIERFWGRTRSFLRRVTGTI
jgi:hypothetical protein